jgi:hypothetical protein
MKDTTTTRHPVAAFQIAPNAPRAVLEAWQRFEQVADAWGESRGTIQDAEAEGRQAVAEATRAATAAAKAGKPVPDVFAVQREQDERMAALRAQAQVQSDALDEVGNELAEAIHEHRTAYRRAQIQREAKARDALAALLAQVREALTDFAQARAAIEWLDAFDAGEARVGRQQQFWGGRLRVDTMALVRQSDANPLALVDVIAQVLDASPVADQAAKS